MELDIFTRSSSSGNKDWYFIRLSLSYAVVLLFSAILLSIIRRRMSIEITGLSNYLSIFRTVSRSLILVVMPLVCFFGALFTNATISPVPFNAGATGLSIRCNKVNAPFCAY